MSSSSVDSVFGLPRPPYEAAYDAPSTGAQAPISDISAHRQADASGADHAEQAQPPAKEVEWVNSELLTISSTIEQLQSRLEEANARLATAAEVETTEFDIGRLFVEAQRFSEDSLSRLELQIHEILCEAEAKARQILTEATEEALEIRRQAQEAAFASTRTARELQAAIAGFTNVNTQLLQELGALNSMLTPVSGPEGNKIEPASDPPESQ
jgi:hypothetical protein